MIAITHCKFYKNEELVSDQTILIKDGKINAITSGAIPSEYRVIDALGSYISPGLTELQIYGSGGKLFSAFPTVDTLRQMDADLISKGTTSFLVCLATNSMDVFYDAITAAKAYRKEAKAFLGLHLEGPFLNVLRKGAHVAEYIHSATLDEVKQLLEHADGTVKMMTLAAELQDDAVIDYLREQGVVLSLGHSDADFNAATKAFNNGFTTTTHLFNAMPSIHHRAPNLPVAVFNHPTAMASIIADGMHVDFQMIKMAYSLMKERLFLITDAVTECDSGPYQHRLLGDKFVTEDGTLSGSNITLLEAVRNCVNHCAVPLSAALNMASLHPSRVIKRDHLAGSISEGKDADLIVFNDDFTLKNVFVSGVEHLIPIN